MKNQNQAQWRKGLYRSRTGMISGVIKGLAEYMDFSVVGLRVIIVLLVFFTSFISLFPAVILYIVAACVMKLEPAVPFENRADREFYDSYSSSRPLAIDRLKRTYESLDRRIRRMESIVTSRDFDWQRRMKKDEG
jgi:phage shock protein C